MNILKWNEEKMGLGIEIIDEQHKKLLNIINKLMFSILNNNQKKDICSIVDELANYIGYHFKTEEALFQDINHEDIINHKKEHDNFRDKIFKINENLKNDKKEIYKDSIETLSDLFKYMATWFANHVIHSDRLLLTHI